MFDESLALASIQIEHVDLEADLHFVERLGRIDHDLKHVRGNNVYEKDVEKARTIETHQSHCVLVEQLTRMQSDLVSSRAVVALHAELD